MPKVTRKERQEIEDFLHNEDINDASLYSIMEDRITVIRNYISDGPGWCGDIFLVVWGEPNFITIVGRRDRDSTYEVMYDITDCGLVRVGWGADAPEDQ